MCAYSQNCVDLPLKLPAGSVEDPHRLLFIGKMDSEPNIDAALYFCKAIIRKVEPRAHVYIVGCEPSEELQALHTGIDVFVTSAVPDATPYLDAAGIVIVPIRLGEALESKFSTHSRTGRL